jgi:hypothetical protein
MGKTIRTHRITKEDEDADEIPAEEVKPEEERKRYMKEDEDEDEGGRKLRKPCRKEDDEDEEVKPEEEATKRKVRRIDGKLVKEDEDEDEDDEDMPEEELTPEDIDEAKRLKRKRRKMRMKGELGGENPQEQAEAAGTSASTITPSPLTPSPPQHIYVPPTGVVGERMGTIGSIATGQAPSEVSYSGKSVNPDLLKSPLFVELSGQLENLQKAFNKKLEAVEKSVSNRIVNLQKSIGQVEKFYNQPFYKAIDEGFGPEGIQKQTITQQIKEGKVRFSQ